MNGKSDKKVWNSLEIAKLIVSLFVPISLFILTYIINNDLKKSQQYQENIIRQNKSIMENNKRIYEHRFEIYKKIKIPINEIFSYIYYVGKWKELSPEKIIMNKRLCDEIMYSNEPLFNKKFFESYENFMRNAFETYNGMGADAKIKSEFWTHKKFYIGKVSWSKSWDDAFVKNMSNDLNSRMNIREAYNELLTNLSTELSLKERKVNQEFKDFKPE
ncbi:hypothetical protein [Winogradskyella sp.]|uniref:hypothetical protein n=1 Tax=Winogradskyella sp. TaxID=1883156 RepID=UPI002611BA33|nr:hypothetical protein [Winogradskyella sp.]